MADWEEIAVRQRQPYYLPHKEQLKSSNGEFRALCFTALDFEDVYPTACKKAACLTSSDDYS